MLSTLRINYEIAFQAPFHNCKNLRTFLVPSVVVLECIRVYNVFILITLLRGRGTLGVFPKIVQEG